MKRVFPVLFLVICLSAVSFAREAKRSEREGAADNVAWPVISSVLLQIPAGNSTWTGAFTVPVVANPMFISYRRTPLCPESPRFNVLVRDSKTFLWHVTQLKGTLDYHAAGAIDQIRFDFAQPWGRPMTCEIVVQAETGGTTPVPSQGELLGVISTPGGFVKDLSIAADPSKRIHAIRFMIPGYCKDTELLEAGTITEGIYDRADRDPAESGLFRVRGGAARVSTIQATVNGPNGQSCNIPVYVYRVQ